LKEAISYLHNSLEFDENITDTHVALAYALTNDVIMLFDSNFPRNNTKKD
jgi:hypothetical protein